MQTRTVGASLLLFLSAVAAWSGAGAARSAGQDKDNKDIILTGRTEAVVTVDLRARATGYLVKALFQDGTVVKQGDLLFEIDPRPYKAAFDAARAKVQLDDATLKFAQANTQRMQALMKTPGVISRQELDKALAEQEQAVANLQESKIKLDQAQLQLDFTMVRAPVAGRIGRRLVDPGNLVRADETLLATIVQTDPMAVFFDLDERTYLRLRRAVKEGNQKAVTDLPVSVALADEEGYPRKGKIDFVDNRVNPSTGTIRVRALLPNPDGLLVPGLFCRVRVQTAGQ